jgi:hypothetical protein
MMLQVLAMLAFLDGPLLCLPVGESPDTSATSPPAAQAVGPVATMPKATEPAWTLRYKFQPEQMLRYETEERMVLEAHLGEHTKRDIAELKQVRRFTVQTVEPSGAARIAMQFESVWMRSTTDDQPPVTFDSSMLASDVPEVFRHTAHHLRGRAPRFWLSDRGRSLHAAPASASPDSEAVQRAVATDSSSDPAPGERIQLVEGVTLPPAKPSGTSGAKAAELDPGSFLMPLPDVPVTVGSSWKETIPVTVRLTEDISREIPILQTYRLESVENGIARIVFHSSIAGPQVTPLIQMQLIQATPGGTAELDIEAGVVLRRDMNFDSSVPGAFGRPEGQVISTGTRSERLLPSR